MHQLRLGHQASSNKSQMHFGLMWCKHLKSPTNGVDPIYAQLQKGLIQGYFKAVTITTKLIGARQKTVRIQTTSIQFHTESQ